jgi:hypothetical protein
MAAPTSDVTLQDAGNVLRGNYDTRTTEVCRVPSVSKWITLQSFIRQEEKEVSLIHILHRSFWVFLCQRTPWCQSEISLALPLVSESNFTLSLDRTVKLHFLLGLRVNLWNVNMKSRIFWNMFSRNVLMLRRKLLPLTSSKRKSLAGKEKWKVGKRK